MDSNLDNQRLLTSAAFIVMSAAYLISKRLKRRKRRWWMVSMNKRRVMDSGSKMLEKLNAEPSGKFENFCRMSASDFEYILTKIGPHITKNNTSMRKAISAKERLAVTLRFLATGDSFVSLSYLFKISNQAISTIVHEVCSALITELRDEIKMPTTSEEWLKIEKIFREQWNFPHCIGAIGGKHIVIQSPFSVVLMAAVDANYCFIFADIGCQGRISDEGVFANCILSQKLYNGELNLPTDKPLYSKRASIPYVFVADDAFPLHRHIMKPYVGAQENGSKERIFNYLLSRARRVVENAFELLASVFRVFRKPMLLQLDKVTNITLACILLHNFLRKSKTSLTYAPSTSKVVDINSNQRNLRSWLPIAKKPRTSKGEYKRIRDDFAEYFITEGPVPWQNTI